MIAADRRQAFNEASRELADALQQERAWLIAPNVCRVRSRNPKHPHVTYDVTRGLDGSLLCCCAASFNYLACYHQDEARKVFDMTTETSTALVPVKLAPSVALLPTEHELTLIDRAAKLAMSGAVVLPTELKTQAQVAAVMLYGLELGLKPMTALRHLYIVKGRVSPSAEVMAGMLMGAEPDARLEIVSISNDECTMRLIRPSRSVNATYTVTWQDIKTAGLANGANVNYPQDRMRYHATKRLLRTYAPDIINAMDGPSIDGYVPSAPSNDDLYNEGDDGRTTEGEYRHVEVDEPAMVQAPPRPTPPPAPPTPAPERAATNPAKGAQYTLRLAIMDLITAYPGASVDFQAWALERCPYAKSAKDKLDLEKLTTEDAAMLTIEAKRYAKSGVARCADDQHEAAYNEDTTLLACTVCGFVIEEPETEPQQAPLV